MLKQCSITMKIVKWVKDHREVVDCWRARTAAISFEEVEEELVKLRNCNFLCGVQWIFRRWGTKSKDDGGTATTLTGWGGSTRLFSQRGCWGVGFSRCQAETTFSSYPSTIVIIRD